MKKFVAILLIAVLLVGVLSGCGANKREQIANAIEQNMEEDGSCQATLIAEGTDIDEGYYTYKYELHGEGMPSSTVYMYIMFDDTHCYCDLEYTIFGYQYRENIDSAKIDDWNGSDFTGGK